MIKESKCLLSPCHVSHFVTTLATAKSIQRKDWQGRGSVGPGRNQRFSKIAWARDSYHNPLPTLRFACVRFLTALSRFRFAKAANRKVGMVEKEFESLSSLELFNFTILSFGAQNLKKHQGKQAIANRKVEMVL